MPAAKRPVSVLVLIHSPDLQVLLLERAQRPGFWQSVTGSQEDCESLAQTASREAQEETGMVVAPDSLVDWRLTNRYEIFAAWRHRYPADVSHNVEHVFSFCVPRATPVTVSPQEHLAHRWLPWAQAAAEVFSWSNRDAILMLPLAQTGASPALASAALRHSGQ